MDIIATKKKLVGRYRLTGGLNEAQEDDSSNASAG
jgi:hypothetical protein